MFHSVVVSLLATITEQPLSAGEFPVGQLEQRVSEVWRMPATLSVSDAPLEFK